MGGRARAAALGGAALMLALAWAARAQPGGANAGEAPAVGFDHIAHGGKVAVAGAAEIPCARCHQLKADGSLRGAPGHASCFGECHGGNPPRRRGRAPYPAAAARRKICQACHAPGALDRVAAGAAEKLRPFYPPYGLEPDFSITFAHDRHAAPSAKARGCRTCHAAPPDPGKPAPRPPAIHSRCAGCHDGKGAAAPMTACKSCHLPAFGPATSPHRIASPFTVRATFSHRAHLARAGAERCRSCHAAVLQVGGDEIPMPDTASCAGCHDGKTAFATTSEACRRCHTAPTERVHRPSPAHTPFSHAAHRARGVALPCATCHRLAKDGALAEPRHAPCSDSGCHRDEFAKESPAICGSCHTGWEPWRPLHVDPRAVGTTEFGARFDHRAHGDTVAACERCHRAGTASGGALPVLAGHAACAGSRCHDRGGAAKPPRSRCADCHQRGLERARADARIRAPWSVRARFDHRPHRTGADGADVPCTRCHTRAAQATDVATMPTPAKPTCAPCHNGTTAFKLTGHSCSRCHGGDTHAPSNP